MASIYVTWNGDISQLSIKSLHIVYFEYSLGYSATWKTLFHQTFYTYNNTHDFSEFKHTKQMGGG